MLFARQDELSSRVISKANHEIRAGGRYAADLFLQPPVRGPVPLGSRALEILIALLERHGELVSKQDLMARVWPNVFVEPTNLTVHMSALRRALRDGQDRNRFIVNIPGRGYCFVASVAVSAHEN